jgi:hypothetical protein
MNFRISGLSAEPFRHLYGLSDETLRARGVERWVANAKQSLPPADNPYRSSHAIFVLEGATAAYSAVDAVPEVLRVRPLSLRAFDRDHRMVDADIVDGVDLEGLIRRLLERPSVAYIHAHYARRGCYAARIDRA